MKMSRKAYVYVEDMFAGILDENDYGYRFVYDEEYLMNARAKQVSLTLPLRKGAYESKALFPFFDGLLPEGWLLDTACHNYKLESRDRFGLLLSACKDPIGNVCVLEQKEEKRFRESGDQETLSVITEEMFETAVRDSVDHGYTVPGVQKKVPLYDRYILKPATEQYPYLSEAEYLTMQMAEKTGIQTVPHALLKEGNMHAYITRWIDRDGKKKIAMEDFCQLDQRLTQDKYHGSYERCAKIIRRYSSRIGIDLSEFFVRIVFCFLTGNSDMHLKNFSLIENERGCVLSSAYDLLPVNVILPEDSEQCALTLNGKKKNIRKKDLYALGEQCGLRKDTSEKLIQRQLKNVPVFLEMIDDSYLSLDLKERYKALMNERVIVLK